MEVSSPILGSEIIEECFAGIGMTREESVRDAFGKFLLGSFHVLIAAFGGYESEQVKLEFWHNSQQTYRIYDGPLLVQGGGAVTVKLSIRRFLGGT